LTGSTDLHEYVTAGLSRALELGARCERVLVNRRLYERRRSIARDRHTLDGIAHPADLIVIEISLTWIRYRGATIERVTDAVTVGIDAGTRRRFRWTVGRCIEVGGI
jgi:hypothetical protein